MGDRSRGVDHPGKFEGSPPPDHPRRCQGTKRRTRERCKRWALKGSERCQFHGGRRHVSRTKGMPKRYAKFLGVTLRNKIEELTSDPHFDQINLYDEIAIARLSATQALKLAEPVLTGSIKVKNTTMVLAMSCLRDAMDHVRDVVVAAAKIEHDAGGKVSLRVVDLVIMQVIKAIHEVCDDPVLADLIEKAVRENVRLPEGSGDAGALIVDGVESTPDVIVMEMDESICGE